jgi:fatty acid desaturase
MEGETDKRRYNIFAILAIIFTFIMLPLGVIFAIIALVQIKKSGDKGRGLAIAALIISVILFILGIITTIAVWSIARSAFNSLPNPVPVSDILELTLSLIKA